MSDVQKGFRAACAGAMAASGLLIGCGNDGGDFKLQTQPQLSVQVDNVTFDPDKPKEVNFQPDQTRGQSTYKKTLLIKNIGLNTADPPWRPLCITGAKADSKNPLLKFNWIGSKPTSAKCPAGTEIGLEPGKAIQGEIKYIPNPDIENFNLLTFTFNHDDNLRSVRPANPVKIVFGISTLGAKIQLDTTDYVYINASAANPPTSCFSFGNVGNDTLVFKGSKLDPANPQYDIQANESANVGDFIDAVGSGNNPKTNPKKLKVCVRYSPDNTPDNEDVKLVILSSDKGSPEVKVSLTAKSETGSWDIKCSNPKGEQKFDFAGVLSGTKESKCILHNYGPAALSINDPKEFEVVALNAGKQAEAEAAYATKLAKMNTVTGQLETLTGANALAADKEWHLIVVYTVPNQGKPPTAYAKLNFQQGKLSQELSLPISPPDCDAPEPAIGPRPEISLHAPFGKSDKARLAIANQGCGALWLQQVCTTPGGLVNPSAPCDKGNSLHFKMVSQAQNVTLLPGALQTFEVEFKPENDKKLTQNDLLHVAYCPGKLAAGNCDTALVAETLNLTGSLIDVGRPTFKPALAGNDAPIVGKKVVISGAYDKGTCPYDGKRYYRWLLTGRPGSSLAWVGESSQSTQVPEVTFVPDKPGDYEVTAQVQVLDEKDENKFVWSAQDKTTISVK